MALFMAETIARNTSMVSCKNETITWFASMVLFWNETITRNTSMASCKNETTNRNTSMAPCENETTDVFLNMILYFSFSYILAIACSRSAMMSSTFSIPTLRRTRSGATPASRNCSSLI